MQLRRNHSTFETRSLRLNVGGDAALVQTRTENGKQFLVSPVVAVISQVLNGEFLSAEEIEKSVAAWEGIPITVNHPPDAPLPTQNQFIARSAIGDLRNMSFEDDKLLGEAWLDLSIARNKAGDIITRIQNGDVVEVSTGYFSHVQPSSGTHDSVAFNGVQTDIVPWHFALLPTKEGACSVDDGCGLPRVNVLGDLSEQARLVAGQFFERFGFESNIEAVQDNAVVATKEGASFRVSYALSESDGKQVVEFGEPEAGDIEFIPRTNAGFKIKRALGKAWTGIKASLQSKENIMDRKELVANVIKNFGLCGEEALKLNDLPEAMLAKLNAKADPPSKDPDAPAAEPKQNADGTPKSKATPQPVAVPPTKEQILEALPPEYKDALDQAIQNSGKEKSDLVATLNANSSCTLTEDQLKALPVAMLKTLNKDFQPVSYLGASAPFETGADSDGKIEMVPFAWPEKKAS